MSRQIRNFTPIENHTIAFSGSATSANVQFTTNTTLVTHTGVLPPTIRIDNPHATLAVFVNWGTDNTAAATVAAGYYVGPGKTMEIDIGQASYVAVIPISTYTGSVYISRGLGT